MVLFLRVSHVPVAGWAHLTAIQETEHWTTTGVSDGKAVGEGGPQTLNQSLGHDAGASYLCDFYVGLGRCIFGPRTAYRWYLGWPSCGGGMTNLLLVCRCDKNEGSSHKKEVSSIPQSQQELVVVVPPGVLGGRLPGCVVFSGHHRWAADSWHFRCGGIPMDCWSVSSRNFTSHWLVYVLPAQWGITSHSVCLEDGSQPWREDNREAWSRSQLWIQLQSHLRAHGWSWWPFSVLLSQLLVRWNGIDHGSGSTGEAHGSCYDQWAATRNYTVVFVPSTSCCPQPVVLLVAGGSWWGSTCWVLSPSTE